MFLIDDQDFEEAQNQGQQFTATVRSQLYYDQLREVGKQLQKPNFITTFFMSRRDRKEILGACIYIFNFLNQ